MLRCQKCNRTYLDETLKFCTLDGGRLASEPDAHTSAYQENIPTEVLPDLGSTVRMDVLDPNKTVVMPQQQQQQTPPPQPRRADTGPATRPTAHQLHSIPIPQNDQPPLAPTVEPLVSPAVHAVSFQPALHETVQLAYAPTDSGSPLPQVSAPASAPPVQKKSRRGLWIGLSVVAILFIVVAGGLAVVAVMNKDRIMTMLRNRRSDTERTVQTTPSTQTEKPTENNSNTNVNSNTVAVEPTSVHQVAAQPPPNSERFVNSRGNLDGKLAENYVDFSFYFPNTWKLIPASGGGGSSNFVKVELMDSPELLLGRFAVSWYVSKGTLETDRDHFPTVASDISKRLSESFKQNGKSYRKVSEGETTVNSIPGYEFRFETTREEQGKESVVEWGRVIFLPPGVTGQKNGVTLLMLATPKTQGVTSVEDVGKQGELAMILDTFRFGM